MDKNYKLTEKEFLYFFLFEKFKLINFSGGAFAGNCDEYTLAIEVDKMKCIIYMLFP